VAKAVEQRAVKKRRFTVEEYHKMGEVGIFSEDDRVELIDGEVVEMSSIGWRHMWCVMMLNRLLSRWIVHGGAETSVFCVTVQEIRSSSTDTANRSQTSSSSKTRRSGACRDPAG
jgi:hypothetical protein